MWRWWPKWGYPAAVPWSHFQDAAISIPHESPPHEYLRPIGHILSDDDYDADEYFQVTGLNVDADNNDYEHGFPPFWVSYKLLKGSLGKSQRRFSTINFRLNSSGFRHFWKKIFNHGKLEFNQPHVSLKIGQLGCKGKGLSLVQKSASVNGSSVDLTTP